MMKAILEINKLSILVKLGVTSQERNELQAVEFNIVITFNELPQACHSDKVEDTICYAKIVDEIKQFCENREFQLIEKLGFSLHQHLQLLCRPNKLKLQVCKSPPIAEIKENCCFTVI